ncbi:MAG: hypothetical protein HAW60_00995 [Bdellovibrionales bacterium]|nr:hypothetical protein [Bdellovibrionales bacterium]
MNKNKINTIKKENGSAIVETLPLLIIFMTILGNMWGFFMSVHSGILSSISARAYAFETFRNRADLTYFRDQQIISGEHYDGLIINYYKAGSRVHYVVRTNNDDQAYPLAVDYGRFSPVQSKTKDGLLSQHSHDNIFTKKTKKGVKEIWIRSAYGMCLNFDACVAKN